MAAAPCPAISYFEMTILPVAMELVEIFIWSWRPRIIPAAVKEYMKKAVDNTILP